VLQCVAVRCSALQYVAMHCSVLRYVAVCCSVLPCVAVCCSVLQCVAVRYIRSQYVAVCHRVSERNIPVKMAEFLQNQLLKRTEFSDFELTFDNTPHHPEPHKATLLLGNDFTTGSAPSNLEHANPKARPGDVHMCDMTHSYV